MALATTHPALVAPALLGAALLVIVAVETIGGPPKRHLAPGLHLVASGAASAARLPADRAADAALIDARPLFSATRRPAHEAGAAGPLAASLRLSAILIGGTDRRVVFEADSHPLVAREGSHAGPYTILSIGADRVTVADASGTHVLRPTALPAGAADATPAAPTSPQVPALQNLLMRLRGMPRSQ